MDEWMFPSSRMNFLPLLTSAVFIWHVYINNILFPKKIFKACIITSHSLRIHLFFLFNLIWSLVLQIWRKKLMKMCFCTNRVCNNGQLQRSVVFEEFGLVLSKADMNQVIHILPVDFTETAQRMCNQHTEVTLSSGDWCTLHFTSYHSLHEGTPHGFPFRRVDSRWLSMIEETKLTEHH